MTPVTLITGGAGFVGSNLADRLAANGRSVLIYDSLTRDHVGENLDWLRRRHGRKIEVMLADVRDRQALRDCVERADVVFHLAAQVAVTTSVQYPLYDFQVNAGGTLEVLEAVRAHRSPPPLVFTSTNKVYGGFGSDEAFAETALRREPARPELRTGVDESRPLDLYSPYGCSKGAADQYVRDYARIYGLRTVVLRMSCIYGPRQFGTEDQGWVAHFLRAAVAGQPITIFGDGRQVRDLLFVDDLVDALLVALQRIDTLAGRVFNLGGGPDNTASLLEVLALIERLTGTTLARDFGEPRPGDQPWYVSDTRAFAAATGWRPRVGVEQGVARLLDWLRTEAAAATEAASAATATESRTEVKACA